MKYSKSTGVEIVKSNVINSFMKSNVYCIFVLLD